MRADTDVLDAIEDQIAAKAKTHNPHRAGPATRQALHALRASLTAVSSETGLSVNQIAEAIAAAREEN